MRVLVNENKVKVADLNVSAVGLLPSKAIIRGVRVSYKQDSEGNATDTIESTRYDCLDPVNYSTFTVKVEGKPIITPEELETKDTPCMIELPLEQVQVKPWKVEFGSATLSISAPSAKLVTSGKQ